jgi:hypothetical protein
MILSVKGKRHFWAEPEFWFILVYNLVILALYLADKVDPYFVIWAYYLQSLMIGAQYVFGTFVFNAKKGKKVFSLKENGMTFFFILHYGLFHFVYFVFLALMSADSEDLLSLMKYIRITFGYLLINLGFYLMRMYSRKLEDIRAPNGFLPYARIAPIHLFIIVGFQSDLLLSGFLIFMLLKIIFDLLVYLIGR